MANPVYVVTSTAKEHGDHQKRQARKILVGSLWAIGLGVTGCGYLYYLAYGYIH